MAVATRVRRTQAERSATTQSALLEATFNAINDLGYRGTTTTEVASRAGVSLGALLHHFPTKSDLLAAAVEHAFDRRQSEYRTAIANLDPTEDRLDAAIDLLWSMFSGPTFVAFLELWVAARTDPDLAAAVIAADKRFMAISTEIFRETFAGNEVDTAPPQIGLHMTYALLDGLAMSRLVAGYRPHPVEEVLATYKAMVHIAIDALRNAEGAAS